MKARRGKYDGIFQCPEYRPVSLEEQERSEGVCIRMIHVASTHRANAEGRYGSGTSTMRYSDMDKVSVKGMNTKRCSTKVTRK